MLCHAGAHVLLFVQFELFDMDQITEGGVLELMCMLDVVCRWSFDLDQLLKNHVEELLADINLFIYTHV